MIFLFHFHSFHLTFTFGDWTTDWQCDDKETECKWHIYAYQWNEMAKKSSHPFSIRIKSDAAMEIEWGSESDRKKKVQRKQWDKNGIKWIWRINAIVVSSKINVVLAERWNENRSHKRDYKYSHEKWNK